VLNGAIFVPVGTILVHGRASFGHHMENLVPTDFQGNFGAQQGKFGADDKAILCPVAQF
jgi:hypothetical protein